MKSFDIQKDDKESRRIEAGASAQTASKHVEPMDANNQSPQEKLKHDIATKAKRKMQSRSAGKQSPWFGLGMFGLVGWSVTIPTLLGIALGSWIDQRWPSSVSWTLTLLFVGVVIGGMNAWYWINKEMNNDDGFE